MMLDSKTYEGMAAYIYIAVMALLLATIFLADDIKGSRSWLSLGPVNVQPAEFAKFATSLMLAKLMGAYGFDLGRWGNLAQVLLVIFSPCLSCSIVRDCPVPYLSRGWPWSSTSLSASSMTSR